MQHMVQTRKKTLISSPRYIFETLEKGFGMLSVLRAPTVGHMKGKNPSRTTHAWTLCSFKGNRKNDSTPGVLTNHSWCQKVIERVMTFFFCWATVKFAIICILTTSYFDYHSASINVPILYIYKKSKRVDFIACCCFYYRIHFFISVNRHIYIYIYMIAKFLIELYIGTNILIGTTF